MTRTLIDRIAAAVLYEGYVLYPYRPSVKNRQRWTFGGLFPESSMAVTDGAEPFCSRTECLVRGGAATAVAVVVRFLHLTDRRVGQCDPPLSDWPPGAITPFRPVQALQVGEQLLYPWQEAVEREVAVGAVELADASDRPCRHSFAYPGRCWLEPVHDSGGAVVGVLEREQHTVGGEVEVSAVPLAADLFRLAVTVGNRTPMEATDATRDGALLRALVSTHVILAVRGGGFLSLMDPPEDCWAAAAECRNVGLYPVLVGEVGQTDTMLASPIILYDYPEVAPESPGDLFDGTEIDEILTKRILTMTDEEKRQAAGADERVRALLARTAALGAEELLELHGVLRPPRPGAGEVPHG
jgi:hydrogenase maturation protease